MGLQSGREFPDGCRQGAANGEILSRASIEAHPVGTRIVLRNRVNGAIVLSNREGLDILESHLAGREAGMGEVARDEFRAILIETWREAGLIDARQDARCGDGLKSPADREACIGTSARALTLASDEAEVFGQVLTLMSDFRQPDPGEDLHRIDIRSADGVYTVFLNGCLVWRPCSPDEARFLVLQNVLALLAGRRRIGAVLHAGLAVLGAGGILVAGDSGTGKSTLVLELLRHGTGFGGDDLLVLDATGAGVVAMPIAAHVKSSKAIDASSASARAAQWIARPGGVLFPKRQATRGDLIGIDAIVFPKRRRGVRSSIRKVEPDEAFVRLIRSGSEVFGPENSVAGLARLVDRTPAFEAEYPDASEIACILMDRFGGKAECDQSGTFPRLSTAQSPAHLHG